MATVKRTRPRTRPKAAGLKLVTPHVRLGTRTRCVRLRPDVERRFVGRG